MKKLNSRLSRYSEPIALEFLKSLEDMAFDVTMSLRLFSNFLLTILNNKGTIIQDSLAILKRMPQTLLEDFFVTTSIGI